MSIKTQIAGFKDILPFKNWKQLFLNRLFFRSQPVNIYSIGDFSILIDHSAGDENGGRQAIVSPMYKSFLNYIPRKKGLTVLDVGANVGGFPLMLALNGFTIKRLISVEFNPYTFTRLQFNMQYNLSGCDYTGLNVALVGQTQLIKVQIDRKGGTSASINQDVNLVSTLSKSIEIQGITLDLIGNTYLKNDETIDIIKMDIEGSEYDVFYHNQNLQLLKRCQYLIIEIHFRTQYDSAIILNTLKDLGFKELSTYRETQVQDVVYLFVNQHNLSNTVL